MYAGVVEEIEVILERAVSGRVALRLGAPPELALGHRVAGQRVVDRHRQQVPRRVAHHRAHVRLEGEVAARVLRDELAVEPDHGGVVHAAEPEHHPGVLPAREHVELRVVPSPANIVPGENMELRQ